MDGETIMAILLENTIYGQLPLDTPNRDAFDSLDWVNALYEIERKTGGTINDSEWEALYDKEVKDILEFTRGK